MQTPCDTTVTGLKTLVEAENNGQNTNSNKIILDQTNFSSIASQ